MFDSSRGRSLLRFFALAGATAVLTGGCSSSSDGAASPHPSMRSAPTNTTATVDSRGTTTVLPSSGSPVPLRAGAIYRPDGFSPSAQFRVTSGWRGFTYSASSWQLVRGKLFHQSGQPEYPMSFEVDVVSTSLASAIGFLRRQPGITVSSRTTTHIGGLAGVELDGVSHTNSDSFPDGFGVPPAGHRFIVDWLQSPVGLVRIVMDAPAASFVAFQRSCESVLHSMRFGTA